MTAYRIANVLVGVMISLLVVTLGLLLWPIKVGDYHTPYKVTPQAIEAGQTVSYISDYCKYVPIKAEVTRTIVDGTVIFLPTATTNLPTGCHKVAVPVTVPINTPPGKYHIEITLVYKINFLREISVTLQTEDFIVTNPCLTKNKPCV